VSQSFGGLGSANNNNSASSPSLNAAASFESFVSENEKIRPMSVMLPTTAKILDEEHEKESFKNVGEFAAYVVKQDGASKSGDGTSTDSSSNKNDRVGVSDTTEQEIITRYAHPTVEQTKAAIVLQKYIRRRLAVKRCTGIKNRAFHRMKCAGEIMSTEKTYVDGLKIISEVYLEPLKKVANGPNPCITKAQLSQVFSDIEVIMNVNISFYEQLQQRLTEYKQDTVISDIFTTMAHFFKSYSRYCNNYEKSQSLLKDLKNNITFRDMVTQMDRDPRSMKLGLSSYLILPIQRIPRYRLLLQDLIKHTEKDHPDYAGLNKALEDIMTVADHLNTTMKGIDATNEILKVQSQFNNDISFIEPHRKFITQGRMMELKETDKTSHPGRDLYFHLFNDILVYSFPVSQELFTYKGEIQLCNAALFDYLRYDSKPESIFQIASPGGKLLCRASSSEEKYKWLEQLAKAINDTKSLRKNNTLNVNVDSVQDMTTSTLYIAKSQDDSEFEVSPEECIQHMKNGATMLKYCRNGRPHFRTIVLSKNERYLMWGSPNKASHESKVALSDVTKVERGQKTAIFAKNKNPEHETLSFSLRYKNRTLDLVCKDKKEYVIWVAGIQYMLSSIMQGKRPINEDAGDDSVVLSHDLTKEKQKFKEMYERIGDAYTWGQGSRGALGHGDEVDQTQPLVMKDFLYLDVASMACENAAAAAVMLTGELFTWGSGEKGRLGHGDLNDRVKPALVKELHSHKIMKVCMGTQHTLALENTGHIWCFGSSEYGQLGMGTEFSGVTAVQTTPILLPALKNTKVRDIACGHWHSACITMDGEVFIWGRGEDGQLGMNNKENVYVPTAIPQMAGFRVVEVALGLWHSIILTDKGQLWTFGNSTYGQLGHGNNEEQLTPKMIKLLESQKVIAVSAGSAHSVCILENGEIYCWGSGIYGQIGNNEKSHANNPTLVKNLKGDGAQKIACGVNHTLALMDNGKVYAWGAGTYGRLGLKSENDQHVPKEITFLADKSVRAIACGGGQSACVCAHQWVPDKDATACMNCKSVFTFIKRRHHCRYCGGIFCGPCTNKRKAILRFGFDDPVRVCEYCYQILSEQSN